jgi:hypothetical protein
MVAFSRLPMLCPDVCTKDENKGICARRMNEGEDSIIQC